MHSEELVRQAGLSKDARHPMDPFGRQNKLAPSPSWYPAAREYPGA
jgi:hypothetical protein